jgi:rhodanese-related sulfurtransferase
MTEAEFVKEVTDGLLPPPGYFGMNVAMNKTGYDSITEVMKRGMNPFTVEMFETVSEDSEVLMLDTRNPQLFSEGFIPNSINIGLDGQFAPWVGALLTNAKQKILIIADSGREEESVKRLARVGYDNVIGYLKGGFEAWKDSGRIIDAITRISAEKFAEIHSDEKVIIDIRRPGEYNTEHIEGAMNIPLDFINESMAEFPKDKQFIMHCASGYRSIIAASILISRGYTDFLEVAGGFTAISNTDVPRTTKLSSSENN